MSEMFECFKTRAEAVSAEVHRFKGKSDALAFLTNFLHQQGTLDAPGSFAVCAPSSILHDKDKQQLRTAVPGLHFDVTRELAANAKIGISYMNWALANTGTLAQDASAVEQRLVSTLPNIHVALVATDTIVPDLPALLTKIYPNPANYLSLITGPSRTADIERVLTIGVHGPERLIILVVDEGLEN